MKYILDTNVYIAAFRGYYNPEICSTYWEVLRELGEKESIKSPKEVKDEIERIDDDLSGWAKNKNPCFLSDDLTGIMVFFMKVRASYDVIKQNAISHWTTEFAKKGQKYHLREEPISDEDIFVVATALFYRKHFPDQEVVVVTKEILKNNPYKPVRIPHLCDAVKVRWINDFEFIKEIGITLEAKL